MTLRDAIQRLREHESTINEETLRELVKEANHLSPRGRTLPEYRAFFDELKRCDVSVFRLHEPVRTSDGDPAHGCEGCDGEDYCSCSERCHGPRCLICKGEWPFCDPDAPEFDPQRSKR